MNIQKINFSPFSNINFAGDKKKKSESLIVRLSKPKDFEQVQDSLIIKTPVKIDQDGINNYIKASKKEVKILEKKANKHKSQCERILKKAKKDEYKHMIHWGKYNINFGVVDDITKLPSSINFWKNGKFAQQYNIKSFEPVDISVYNCENKDNIEEFFINDYGLNLYKAKNPYADTVKLICPLLDGYNKIEGIQDKYGNILKTKEIEYLNSDLHDINYYEYNNNDCRCFEYNKENKNWITAPNKRKDILKNIF